MATKRKPNPYALATEQAHARAQEARIAREKAASKAEKGAGVGLKKMLASRASAAIEANVAAPSVVLGNALAMAAGAAPLDVERLGVPLTLTLDQRKALPQMLSDARLPGKNWVSVLLDAFEQPKAWAPQKPAAPVAPKSTNGTANRGAAQAKGSREARTGSASTAKTFGGAKTTTGVGKSPTRAAKPAARSASPLANKGRTPTKSATQTPAPVAQVVVRKRKALDGV